VGSSRHVLSCQPMSVVATRVPNAGHAYPVVGAPGRGDWIPGSLLGRGWRGNGPTGGEILSATLDHGRVKRRHESLQD
jgi:hypothetical protein